MKQNEIDFLKSVEIFSRLNEDEIRMIKKFLYQTDAGSQEILFREGDTGSKMYILKSGEVEAFLHYQEKNERKVAVFKPGDFFGEMAIFQKAKRSATCITSTECWFYVLIADEFIHFLKEEPDTAIKIMYKMLNIITDRLQDTSSLLADLVSWGDKAVKRTITDEMTGVYNRKYFEETLAALFEEYRHNGKPLTLIMSDLDHFGDINKLYDHQTGDQAILAITGVYKKMFRKTDLVCRYGGDEFAMIMPETTPEQAEKIIIKVLEGIRKLDTLADKNGPMKQLTLSVGIVSLKNQSIQTVQDFKDLSDKALYQAKEQGRDRYVKLQENN